MRTGLRASCSSVSQSWSWPCGLDQGADQLVAVAGDEAGDVGGRTEVVARRDEGAKEFDRAGRGVQADRVADAGVLGRVRGEDQRHLLVAALDVAQPGVAYGDPRDAGGTLGVGHVGGQAVVVELLEGERDGDQAAVELGDGDLGGGVQRGEALVVLLPRAAGAGQAQGLEDRHAERGQGSRRPRTRRRHAAEAVAGLVPPAARTVVTMASADSRAVSSSCSGARREET